ncbi:hypothetical protein QJS66_09675 [Kocuria rhizophila]|nr:hypothetical protein QJS66_09675 [Kocuria rhizophila]
MRSAVHYRALIACGTTPVDREGRQAQLRGLRRRAHGVLSWPSWRCVGRVGVDRPRASTRHERLSAATMGTVEGAAAYVNSLGLSGVHVTPRCSGNGGRGSARSPSSPARAAPPTLAVGLAHIMNQWFGGASMMSFWYHFAIMLRHCSPHRGGHRGTARPGLRSLRPWGTSSPRSSGRDGGRRAWLTTAVMGRGLGFILTGRHHPSAGSNTLLPSASRPAPAAIALLCASPSPRTRGASVPWHRTPAAARVDVVVTVTGSRPRFFSSDPKVGHLGPATPRPQHALEQGKTSFGRPRNTCGHAGASTSCRAACPSCSWCSRSSWW